VTTGRLHLPSQGEFDVWRGRAESREHALSSTPEAGPTPRSH
jgi:hypothetical protein